MSHDSIVAAAVAAAAAQGVETTVIVIGSGGTAASQVPEHITVEHEHYQHSMTDTEVAGKLTAAINQIEALTTQLAQRDEVISGLQQATENAITVAKAAVAAGGPEQPTDTVSIDSFSIDVLGIADDVAKKIRKIYPTVGALRDAATTGKLADLKLKGGQKAIIDVHERLLGLVPPERIPAQAPAPTTAAAAADGVPSGHADRPWLDRLGAVKAKERDMQEWATKIAAARQAYPVETDMPDAEYDKLVDARHEHDIAKSQVVALVWGLGLDKEGLRTDGDGGSVDACLIASGLSHLTDAPQPRMVPETAAAS